MAFVQYCVYAFGLKQWEKGRVERTWKKQVTGKSMMVGLSREDAHCR